MPVLLMNIDAKFSIKYLKTEFKKTHYNQANIMSETQMVQCPNITNGNPSDE